MIGFYFWREQNYSSEIIKAVTDNPAADDTVPLIMAVL